MDDSPQVQRPDVREVALRPMLHPGPFFWVIVLALGVLVLGGMVAFLRQFRDGLGVTGLNNRVSWGVYTANIVFFIGLSYGGAVTSAILRLTNARWRAPLTRMAEAMALVTLCIGGLFPIIHLGRPDRVLNILLHPQVGSPLVWDVVAISTYMAATIIFLYLPLIPDIAHCRDRLGAAAGRLRQRVYSVLSLGWQGTAGQRHLLEQNMTIVAIVIIPLAISVHSVLAWLFSMNSRPGWNSTIFGPYFVVAALFSGVAAVILVVAAFRKAYHLEDFIEERHFKYLANIMLALGMGYAYFTFAELITEGYKMEGYIDGQGAGALLEAMLLGQYAPLFWAFVLGGLALPLALVSLPPTRNVPGIVMASALVVVAMWVKRVIIVVPVLATPNQPVEWGAYWPSEVEIAITLAAVAAIPLLLMLFFRVFPIISIYEVEEMQESESESENVAAWTPAEAH